MRAFVLATQLEIGSEWQRLLHLRRPGAQAFVKGLFPYWRLRPQALWIRRSRRAKGRFRFDRRLMIKPETRGERTPAVERFRGDIMSAVFGEKVNVAQEKGPDVLLAVFGDEFYARYETPDGYSVVHDPEKGLFCYAELRNGEFHSTGIDLSHPAPAGLVLHAKESAEVRQAKAAKTRARRGQPKP